MHHALVTIHADRHIGPVSPRLYGSFVEHLGRCVYNGLYEPGHPTADRDGFRQDVVQLVKELGVTTIRYPGGNFVSGFKWEDSVGPRERRPRRLDLAWHSTETNEVGLHEFHRWLEQVGSELMLAVNLGTRGVAEALDLLEYTSLPSGTELAAQRIENDKKEPFDVRMWCLGNEMDGPWQLGHRSAEDYGKLAAATARAMKAFDPDLELVLCGSSSSTMPTFGSWERTVLSHAYDLVDYISCHSYYENKGDLGSFLASGVDMDRFIDTVVQIADEVKAERGSSHTMSISFDEWNVWYNTRFENVDKITGVDNWPVAPRLLEDVYTVADAVVVGGLLITLLRHADRVQSASLAQLVNVIAPIMTEPGGPAWRQTIFYPFAATSRHGRGTSLRLEIDPKPTRPQSSGRSLSSTRQPPSTRPTSQSPSSPSTELSPTRPTSPSSFRAGDYDVAVHTLHDEDPLSANTLAEPDRVRPEVNATARLDRGTAHRRAPAHLLERDPRDQPTRADHLVGAHQHRSAPTAAGRHTLRRTVSRPPERGASCPRRRDR